MIVRTSRRGFSLVEVVIAVGVFALAIPAMIALLAALSRSNSISSDQQIAVSLADAISTEVKRLADLRGFDAMANSIPVMSDQADSGFKLVAGRDDSVRELAVSESPLRDQYFLIEVRRFTSGQLAYSSAASHLALNVRITWPYRVLAGATLSPATNASDRTSVSFNLSLNR